MRFGSKDPSTARKNAEALRADREQTQQTRLQRRQFAGLDLADEPEEETWVTTYMDLLTLLLVLFVVLLASADFNTTPEDRTRMEQATAFMTALGIDLDDTSVEELAALGHRLRSDFQAAGFGDQVEITASGDALTVRLSDKILFQSGEAHFTDAQAIELMQPLVVALKRNEYYVSVEGHTDSVPIQTARFPSNWELSSARASFVVRHLIEQGVPPYRLRAIGYGESQPIGDNQTEAGRQLNRRVHFVLRRAAQE